MIRLINNSIRFNENKLMTNMMNDYIKKRLLNLINKGGGGEAGGLYMCLLKVNPSRPFDL